MVKFLYKIEYKLYNASQIPNEHTIITKCICGEIFQGRGEDKKALKNFETALAQLYLICATKVDEDDKNKGEENEADLNVYSPEENERIADILEKIAMMYLRKKKHYKCIQFLQEECSHHPGKGKFLIPAKKEDIARTKEEELRRRASVYKADQKKNFEKITLHF